MKCLCGCDPKQCEYSCGGCRHYFNESDVFFKRYGRCLCPKCYPKECLDTYPLPRLCTENNAVVLQDANHMKIECADGDLTTITSKPMYKPWEGKYFKQVEEDIRDTDGDLIGEDALESIIYALIKDWEDRNA